MAHTLESLHDDIVALSTEVGALRAGLTADIVALRQDMIRLEAKIDSKPSLMAMFTGIFVTVFGMAGAIASTIAVLHTLGFIR